MKLTPMQGPGVPSSGPDVQKAQVARERAIAVASGQAQQDVVQNQNAIQAEEMGAIRPPTPQDMPARRAIAQEESDNLPIESESEVTEEVPRQDKNVSRELTMLARRERALRAQAQKRTQEFKAKEAELQAKEQEILAKARSYESGYISKEEIQSNPLKVLVENGISYEKLTQDILNQGTVSPAQESLFNELRNEIKALKTANEEFRQQQEESQTSQYQAAVKQIEKDARDLIKQDPSFELIRATKSIKDVVELITRTYDKEGVMMTVEEAASEVERYLEQETQRLTRTQKIRQRLAKELQAQKPQKQQVQSGQQPKMKTLTNDNSRSSQLDAKARAILAFKGQLNQ